MVTPLSVPGTPSASYYPQRKRVRGWRWKKNDGVVCTRNWNRCFVVHHPSRSWSCYGGSNVTRPGKCIEAVGIRCWRRVAGAGSSALGTSDAREGFLRSSSIHGLQKCPEIVMVRGATKNPSDLTDLVDEAQEVECIVCLHWAEGNATLNEDMQIAVRWILETTHRLINKMGESVRYPSGMHWLDCCHQPVHVTCLMPAFYRIEEWKCPLYRRTLVNGLWGPSEKMLIDPSVWPGSFQDVFEFVQRRLPLMNRELHQLMQAMDEEDFFLSR